MEQILNSVDCIIVTNDDKLLFIKREKEPFKGHFAIVGGMQEPFESLENALIRVLKRKLGLITEIRGRKIAIKGLGTYDLVQFKTYDSGVDIRGGNTTVYAVELDKSAKEVQKIVKRDVYFFDKNNIPLLAFEHNKFISEYFFFIRNYTIAKIPGVGVTVDIVIMTVKDRLLKVLLAKRSKEPFKGSYTLPGGFIDKEKSLNECARDILRRDTNIRGAYLEQLYTFGDVNRDKRGRVISVAYYALVDFSKLDLISSPKYDELGWFSLSDINKMWVGFDHKKIIDMAVERIRNKIEYTNIAFQLLPEKFTLAELQEVYETILERELDKRNFRKKIAELDMLEELDEFKKEGRMRPARYYRFKERTKETILKPKKWI